MTRRGMWVLSGAVAACAPGAGDAGREPAARGLSAAPAWSSAPAAQLAAGAGTSVATAGDVDGDGFEDLLAGIPGWDGDAAGEGKVVLYAGGAAFPAATPIWEVEPADAPGAACGASVAGAGDVDADGFADVVFGCPGFSAEGSGEGRVYVYRGGPGGLASTPAWTLDPVDVDGAGFGTSVATAGDCDGDGDADVLVGAPGEAGGGRAYFFPGGPGAPAASWSAQPAAQPGAEAGFAVAPAGDVNADGYGDVLVGAPGWDGVAVDEGRGFLFLCGPGGPAPAPAWSAEPVDQAGARFGQALAGAGDAGGDGFADVAIAAPFWNGVGAAEGRVYFYAGDPLLILAAPVTVDPADQAGARLGESLRGAGDVTGDGRADLIAGAPGWNTPPILDEGIAYLLIGDVTGALAPAPALATQPADQSYAAFGQAVAGGDLDGDGLSDLVAGAPGWDGPPADRGMLYAFRGGGDHPAIAGAPAWEAHPTAVEQAGFSSALAWAGDVNGDGYADLLVGAPGWEGTGPGAEGRAYVYHGGATGLGAAAAWWKDPAEQAAAFFGWSVARAGDVNGDGFDDVIAGAPYWDEPGAPDAGRAYVYHGGATGLAAIAAWAPAGTGPGTLFAWSVAGAGDVNGDGFGDVIVTAPNWDGAAVNEGRAYLFLGGAGGLGTTPAWVGDPTDQAGAGNQMIASAAGDLDGDGLGDVLLGFPYWDEPGVSNTGRVYLYRGTPSGLEPLPAWSATVAPLANAHFGAGLGGAGDVNGDGYGDVIVGAPGWFDGASNEGMAYLFLGGAGVPETTPAWSAHTSDTYPGDELYGAALAGIGDVTGDGLDDVAVAAPGFYDATFSSLGRVEVYAGSSAGLPAGATWFVRPPPLAGDEFGAPVAGAADENGDAVPDLVTGAPAYDGASVDVGAAFVHLGGDGAPPGVARFLAQRRAGGQRVPPGGRASGPVTFEARLTHEIAAGGRFVLEVEARPMDQPLDGMATSSSPPGRAGELAQVVIALAPGAYRWRARVRDVARTGHSRWFGFGANRATDADLRVVAPGPAANGAACAAPGDCLSGVCEDGMCCQAACGVCSSCDAAGAACAVAPVDDPACGAIDCDLLDVPCRDFADLTSARCAAPGDCLDANTAAACPGYTPVAGACDDGDPCTASDACSAGLCLGGGPTDCDDADPCTSDTCDPAAGCQHQPYEGPCDDLDPCRGGDTCASGVCAGTFDTDCDDENECTADSCATPGGCLHTPVAGACDDEDACTVDDECAGTSCAGMPRDCTDDDPCNTDGCDPVTGCYHVPGECVTDAGVDSGPPAPPADAAIPPRSAYACDCRAAGRVPMVSAGPVVAAIILAARLRRRRGRQT